jgi:hypothetical protein
MDRRAILDVMLTTSLVLLCAAGAGAAEEKAEPASVEEAFRKFALAVKDDKYEEVLKYIAPPGEKVWINLAAVQTAAAKYEAALNQKFGKGDERSILEQFGKPNLAKRYYEARGTIREVKEIGKDRTLVTVWTKGPRFGDDADAIYERKFTAVKVEGQWKFQLPPPWAEGSAVVKKVKRTGPDGKIVEVYAEHNPKGSADENNWEELKPSTYEGREQELKLLAEVYARFAEVLPTQMEQVQKGSYKTRKEALDTLEKAFRELVEKGLKELKNEPPPPKSPAFQAPKEWQAVEPGEVTSARFQIGERDRIATMTVTGLKGDGGGLAANISRWRKVVGLEPLAEKDVLTTARPIKVDGISGHSVDLTGPEVTGKPTPRILVAVVKHGNETWFFKLEGPANLVAAQKSAFDGFLKSVRFEK